MIQAKEAWAVAEEVVEKTLRERMATLAEKIRAVSSNGGFSLTEHGEIGCALKKRLEMFGYKVSHFEGDQRDPSPLTFTINWAEAE